MMGTVLADARLAICCGTGGVGKTTTAAALAIAAARQGRRVAVVTIDPARRLADALGLGGLTSTPERIPLDGLPPDGELWGLMLDARAAFDALVVREAGSPEQAQRILSNRFYRNVADTLGGTQEYMAVEVLHSLLHPPADAAHGAFDLVVLDTPPTRNALDFVDAPRRLTRLLDNPVFRAMTRPARIGVRLMGAATQVVLRSVGKVVGGDVVADAVAFFQAFEGMEDGFRRRAAETLHALGAPTTRWLLVTTPRADAVEEAQYFAEQLKARSMAVSAVIVNLATPVFEPLPTMPSRAQPEDGDTTSALLDLLTFAQDKNALAALEQATVAPLRAFVGGATPIRWVEDTGDDIHDLAGLTEFADRLASAPVAAG